MSRFNNFIWNRSWRFVAIGVMLVVAMGAEAADTAGAPVSVPTDSTDSQDAGESSFPQVADGPQELRLDLKLSVTPEQPEVPVQHIGIKNLPPAFSGEAYAVLAEQGLSESQVDALPAPASIDEVMVRVWSHNPQVIQAESAVRASGYDITAARAAYLPYMQIQSAMAQDSRNNNSTLYVVVPLWNGGYTGAQVGTAKARQRAALAELGRVRWQLGGEALQAYFGLVAAQDQHRQWQTYAGRLEEMLETIQRRAKQGMAPTADVDTALARLRQAEAGVASSRAQIVTARAQLIRLLGAEPGPVFWPRTEALLSDEDVARAGSMLHEHPSYLAALAQVELQKNAIRTAKASLWPELSLQHRRQLDGLQFDPTNDATLLVATYQSGSGLQGAFGVRAEEKRLDSVKFNLKAVDREIAATLEVDKAQLSASASQLAAQYGASDAMESLVGSFMRQFEAGRKSWLEVLNIQREENDVVLQGIAFKRSYWQANAQLALDAMYWDKLGARIVRDSGDAQVERSE